MLPGDHDAVMVAENSFEACHYLWRLHQRGKLTTRLSAATISVGYHVPCHTKALGVGRPAENLLRLIPGCEVDGSRRVAAVSRGCTVSSTRTTGQPAGRVAVDPRGAQRRRSSLGSTECSTCKIQMEQRTTKPTIHPVKTARAGLRADARACATLIKAPAKQLVVT